MQNLLGEIEALKPEFNKVTTEGNEAIAGGQLGKLKRQGVKTAMKSLKDLLEKKEQNATTRLNEYAPLICLKITLLCKVAYITATSSTTTDIITSYIE